MGCVHAELAVLVLLCVHGVDVLHHETLIHGRDEPVEEDRSPVHYQSVDRPVLAAAIRAALGIELPAQAVEEVVCISVRGRFDTRNNPFGRNTFTGR